MSGRFFTVFLLILFFVILSVFVMFSMHFYTHNETSQYRNFNESFDQIISEHSDSTSSNSSSNSVSIEVLEDSITKDSAKILVTDENNSYSWGESYRLEKKVDDKNWEELELNNDNFIDLGYNLSETTHQVEIKVNFKKYYGSLDEGTYRIVKRVLNHNTGDYETFYSNEFEIE